MPMIDVIPPVTAVPAGWSAWVNASVLLLASWIVIAIISLQPRPGAEVVAVLFPPAWNSQQVFSAIAASEAALVRMTGLTSIVVVRPSDHQGMTRLRQAGVWLAIDPRAIASCVDLITGRI
jgi:hypothetical protein